MVDIHLASGEQVYVGGTVTALFGADISADTFLIALGTSPTVPPLTADPAWVAPSLATVGDNTSERIILLLVAPPATPGRYFVWVRVADHPEIKAGCVQRNVNVYT